MFLLMFIPLSWTVVTAFVVAACQAASWEDVSIVYDEGPMPEWVPALRDAAAARRPPAQL